MNCSALHRIIVPDMGAGRCLGPEKNGFSFGGGGGGGDGPPGNKEDTWRRKTRTRRDRCDEEGPAGTE